MDKKRKEKKILVYQLGHGNTAWIMSNCATQLVPKEFLRKKIIKEKEE
jgi:hypothetical protein